MSFLEGLLRRSKTSDPIAGARITQGKSLRKKGCGKRAIGGNKKERRSDAEGGGGGGGDLYQSINLLFGDVAAASEQHRLRRSGRRSLFF